MKSFILVVFVIISGLAILHAKQPSEGQIVVVMKHESPFRPEINGEAYSMGGLNRFLTDSAERFGSKKPVFIRLDEAKDIYLALTFVQMAHKTHDSVSLEISPPKSDGPKYIVEIPKNGIKTVFDGNVGSGHTIIPDPNPNRQRDIQMQRLQNLQNGVIESK